jgi:hypothetical protein
MNGTEVGLEPKQRTWDMDGNGERAWERIGKEWRKERGECEGKERGKE